MTRQPIVVGLGEVLMDRLPQGERVGGAPVNAAFHASQLGAAALVCSRIGQDCMGMHIRSELMERGLDVSQLQSDAQRATGVVHVTHDADGQPSYDIVENAAWDAMQWSESWQQVAASADAVFYGTLGMRHATSRETIRRFLEAASGARRVFDVNVRMPWCDRDAIRLGVTHAGLVKFSESETAIVAEALGCEADVAAVAHELMDRHAIEVVAITLGARGSVLYSGDDCIQLSASPLKVVDPVGAGDAYLAGLTIGLLRGHDLATSGMAGRIMAESVIARVGAMPILGSDLDRVQLLLA